MIRVIWTRCISPCLMFLCLLLPPLSLFAATLSVPTDYPTIQAAIDASQDGDTIIVQPGTYQETISFKGTAITLTSTNPKDPSIVASTIIDGNNQGSVVTFSSGETTTSILMGFTIQHGTGTLIDGKRYGGGIYCGDNSSATIRYNKIINNSADVGGGVYLHGNSPPTLEGPTASYPYAAPNQTVTLSVTASDPDDDTLTYTWTSSGNITGSGPSVSFSSPTPGAYPIKVTVTDGHGGKVEGTVSVTVIGITIQALPQLLVGQPATLTATLTPSLADSPQYPVTITWSLLQGTGSFDANMNGTAQAKTITFTPSASGPGTVKVVYAVGSVSTSHQRAFSLNPVVSTIQPTIAFQGETIDATITGNNLGRVTAVSTGSGVVATILAGKTETTLPVRLVIAETATAGNRSMSLTTPEGQVSTSLTFQIRALPPITPNVSSLSLITGIAGSITFSIPSPAQAGGLTLTLSSSAPTVASVPASVNIPEGQTSVAVSVTPLAYGTTTITASASGYSKGQATITVTNPPLITFAPSPITVPVGITDRCSITISNPAPSEGLVVTLTGSAHLEVPSSVTVPYSQISTNFSIKGLSEGTATITASAAGYPSSNLSASVIVEQLTLFPNTLSIAVGRSSSLLLSVPNPAPQGGLVVTIQSSNTAVINPRASVAIPQGQTSVSIPITGLTVGTATVSANHSGLLSAQATIAVLQASMSFTPPVAVVAPSTSLQAEITLSSLAPQGGSTIIFSNPAPDKFSVPESVLIPAGQRRAAFTISGLSTSPAVAVTASGSGLTDGGISITVDASRWIVGTEGNDGIYGPVGVGSTIFGKGGNDEIYCSYSDDTAYGGTGNDRLFGNSGNDTLYGEAGDDRLSGDAGNDRLYGGDGKDGLLGGDGNDYLDGGPGDDNLSGDAGDDTYVYGIGSSYDTIDETSGNDTLQFGPGITPDDVEYSISSISGDNGIMARIKSTGEYVRIRNWFAGDTYRIEHFVFEDGSEQTAADVDTAVAAKEIVGGAGNDTLYGPYSIGVTIYGNGGNDSIYGGNAADRLYGGTGSDYISGGNGNDTLYGEAGDDRLSGDAGNDMLYGGDGKDGLLGGDGNDYLDGGPGDDNLFGGVGDDTYFFSIGCGHDIINYETSGNDTLQFGPGIMPDDIEYYISGIRNDNGIVVRIKSTGEYVRICSWFAGDSNRIEHFLFEDGTEHTAAQVDVAARAAGVKGGSLDDTLHGPSGSGVSYFGFAGNDSLYAGTGNDYLDGGIGDDTLEGGAGDDTYFFGIGSGHDGINETAGNDTLKFGPGITPDNIEYCLSGSYDNGIIARIKSTSEHVKIVNWFTSNTYKVELFLFEDGTEHTASQVEAAARAAGIKGGDGRDTLYGSYGNDYLDGGPGDDTIVGRDGDDTYFFGIGSGHDLIYDEAGNDTLKFGPGITPDDIEYYISGKSGDNGIVARIKSTGEYALLTDWFSGDTYKIEHFLFEDGTEHTTAQVDAVARTAGVRGGDGNDSLWGPSGTGVTYYGNGGDDQIYGGSGDDTAYGGTGNDLLDTGGGNDNLDGGPGDDTLQGGAGDDTYVFGAGYGRDTIFDDSGNDALRFGSGITPDNVEYRLPGDMDGSLIARIKSTGEYIRIRYWFDDDARYQVDHFIFQDGTEQTAAQVEAAAVAAGVRGGDGNDVLYGTYGDDYLDGGPGNDYLSGEAGDDTYFFGIGSGYDTIYDRSGNDTLKFGPGITFDNVEYYISGIGGGNSIVARIKSTGEYVRILYWLSNTTYQIERFVFEDGTELTAAQVDALARAAGVK